MTAGELKDCYHLFQLRKNQGIQKAGTVNTAPTNIRYYQKPSYNLEEWERLSLLPIQIAWKYLLWIIFVLNCHNSLCMKQSRLRHLFHNRQFCLFHQCACSNNRLNFPLELQVYQFRELPIV